MSLARSHTLCLLGLNAHKIVVEADISANLPAFILVGLPDASLSESPARVRAACKNSGLELPPRKITVNLSPASVPKYGASFDLAIAITVLAAAGHISSESLASTIHLGELALDGTLLPVRGIVPMVLGARAEGFEAVVVPEANLQEARLVSGINVVGFDHLTAVARFHGSNIQVVRGSTTGVPAEAVEPLESLCFSDVRGQSEAVEAAVVAAAGGHHMSLIGAPGCGKTMIAQRLPTILPALTDDQALELASLRSLSSGLTFDKLDHRPPFVAPHHSSSMVSLVGGGSGMPKPGMLSKANTGVLFLDEAPEFNANVLDALRQPLESGEVQIARANFLVRYPARVQLVLAANPCPCAKPVVGGFASCECPERVKQRYLGKISGPLLDRVDIQLRMRPAKPQVALGVDSRQQTSAQLSQVVVGARDRAKRRLQHTPWSRNAEVSGSHLRRNFADLPGAERLKLALTRGAISMRGFDKCLRLAWTLADLGERARPSSDDFAKAIWLRGVEPTFGR
jgi:magnesium chelatase family protein